MTGFLRTPRRRTFTYCKPLVMQAGGAPVELSRLDSKNWTPTPADVQRQLAGLMARCLKKADGMVVLDQVDLPETGVVTSRLLKEVARARRATPRRVIVADCRRGLGGYPPVGFKMNQAELAALSGDRKLSSIRAMGAAAAAMAEANGRPVVVTLADRGMLGAGPDGVVEHVPALPVQGPIDIVGAGDAVTANLVAALAAGATVGEAIRLANAAASVVVHQLGTTGTATVKQIQAALNRGGG
jgi:bifunctional ADP-heptose synthase (sugar kinase/adenylyltransferase)